MSQENAEIVRRAYDALNRGDLDGVVADFAPEFEYVPSGAIPGAGGVYQGAEGFRQFLERFWEEFDGPQIEVHEFIKAREQVVASTTLRGVGKQSGVETGWDIWQLWTVEDGEVVHGQAFTSRDEALEAAGLQE